MPPLLLLLFFLPTVLSDHPPPRYRIQLNDPAESRWDKVIDDHKTYLPLFAEEANKVIPRPLQRIVWSVAQRIRYLFPEEFRREIEGVAERSGVPLGLVVGLNILYDITAFDRKHILYEGCTSLVACDAKGRLWHGRNLDFEMGELLRNITIVADFYRGDKLVYSGTTFALYIGLLTGQRPHAFTVSLNARYDGAYIKNIFMAFVTRFKHPVSFVIRQTLESESTFASAVCKLANVDLICPAYIVVAGVNPFEGALITRNRRDAADVEYLSKDRWFFVETNYDHWKPAGDKRRDRAIQLLTKLGREKATGERLMRVLRTEPINNNSTIYSGVMTAATPAVYYKTTVVRD